MYLRSLLNSPSILGPVKRISKVRRLRWNRASDKVKSFGKRKPPAVKISTQSSAVLSYRCTYHIQQVIVRGENRNSSGLNINHHFGYTSSENFKILLTGAIHPVQAREYLLHNVAVPHLWNRTLTPSHGARIIWRCNSWKSTGRILYSWAEFFFVVEEITVQNEKQRIEERRRTVYRPTMFVCVCVYVMGADFARPVNK